jgi:hypothetical protein
VSALGKQALVSLRLAEAINFAHDPLDWIFAIIG